MGSSITPLLPLSAVIQPPVPPVNPIVALLSSNADGLNDALLSHGDSVASWKNLGSDTVADFTNAAAYAQPVVKKSSLEKSLAFDGMATMITSPGSKTALKFVHETGIFDLVLVLRRRDTQQSSERRIFGSCEGQRGFFVGFNGSGSGGGEGTFWVILGSGAVLNANFRTSSAIAAPLGTPYKVLIRGDGTNLKISHNFSTFESQAFSGAFGTGDANYDYSLGAINPLQLASVLFEGDVFSLLLYNRNLIPAELAQLNTFLQAQVGSGV